MSEPMILISARIVAPLERWADVPGTLLTPHRAGGATEGIPNMLPQALENIRLFLAGQPVSSPAP